MCDQTSRPDFDALLFDIMFAIAKSIHTPRQFLTEHAEPITKNVIASAAEPVED
jgi:hypothetical protein